jgi:hypothetical protein
MVAAEPDALFGRVAAILDQARGNVVRAVNTQMVLAYWLIGREIVEAVQGGEERAAYGKGIVADLSGRLTQRYGKGFSAQVLWSYRQFYLAYSDRGTILFPPGRESPTPEILFLAGRELTRPQKSYPAGSETLQGFAPQLTWSHYRALMRVDSLVARDFYEREAIDCGWSKVQLEWQIHSFYFERIISNRGTQGLLPDGRERLPGEKVQPAHLLKSPMVLEFLGLPDFRELHESKLEQAIIDNLQNLPTEEQLRLEIERERRLIESALEDRADE